MAVMVPLALVLAEMQGWVGVAVAQAVSIGFGFLAISSAIGKAQNGSQPNFHAFYDFLVVEFA